MAKVAQGGGRCEEVLSAVDGQRQSRRARYFRSPHHGRQRTSYADLGIATSSVSDAPRWDAIYSDAPWMSIIAKGDDPVSGAPLKIMVDANVWVDSFAPTMPSRLPRVRLLGRRRRQRTCYSFPVHIARTYCMLYSTN